MANSGKIDIIIGDSIAVNFYIKRINMSLLSGAFASGLNEDIIINGKVNGDHRLGQKSGTFWGITVGGRGTKFFADNFEKYLRQNDIKDKNILISSGFSNDVGLKKNERNQKVDNGQEIWDQKKLQTAENNINKLFKLINTNGGIGYVIGVSTYAAFNPGNNLLKKLSDKYKFTFLGGFEPSEENGARVHVKNSNAYYSEKIEPALSGKVTTTESTNRKPLSTEKNIKSEVANNIQEAENERIDYNNIITEIINQFANGIFKEYEQQLKSKSFMYFMNVNSQNDLDIKINEITNQKIVEAIKNFDSNDQKLTDIGYKALFYNHFLLNLSFDDGKILEGLLDRELKPITYKYVKETILSFYIFNSGGPVLFDEFNNAVFTENKKQFNITEEIKRVLIALREIQDNGSSLLDEGTFTTGPFIAGTTGTNPNNYKFCSFGSLFKTFIQTGIGMSTAAYSTIQNNQTDSEVDIQIISYTFNEKAGPILSNLPIMMMPVHLKKFKTEYAKLIFSKKDNYMTIDEFMNFFFESILNDPRSITNPMHVFYNNSDEVEANVIDEDGLKTYLASADPIVIPQICALVETLTEDQMNGELLVKEGDKTFSGSRKKILRIHIFDKAKNPYSNIKKINFDDKENVFRIQEDYGQDIYGEKLSPEKLETVQFEPGFSNIALRNFLTKKVPVIQIGHTTSNVTSVSITSNQNPRDTANRVTQFYKSDTNFGGNLKNNDIFNLPIRIIPANLSMTTVGCPMPEIGQVYYIDLGTGTSLDSLYVVTKVSHTFGQGKFETNLEFVPQDGLAQFEQAIINFKSDSDAPTTTTATGT